MANQANKKAEQRVKDFRTYHGGSILALLALYALLRFVVFSAWESLHAFFFGGSVVVMYTCYSWIFGHLFAGGTLDPTGGLVDKCRDVLYINMFAMGTSLINDNFLWILILIPLYATYQMLSSLLNWITAPKEEEPEIQLSKTQQKKQKKAEKFGYADKR